MSGAVPLFFRVTSVKVPVDGPLLPIGVSFIVVLIILKLIPSLVILPSSTPSIFTTIEFFADKFKLLELSSVGIPTSVFLNVRATISPSTFKFFAIPTPPSTTNAPVVDVVLSVVLFTLSKPFKSVCAFTVSLSLSSEVPVTISELNVPVPVTVGSVNVNVPDGTLSMSA